MILFLKYKYKLLCTIGLIASNNWEAYIINGKFLTIALLFAVVLVAGMVSGCLCGSVSNKSSLVYTGDNITISGTYNDKFAEQTSDEFDLTEGMYFVTWTNSPNKDGFWASVDTPNVDTHAEIALGDKSSSGTACFPVNSTGNIYILRPGKHTFSTIHAGTYSVTISGMPASGVSVPFTLKSDGQRRIIATPVYLNAGPATITLSRNTSAGYLGSEVMVYDEDGNVVSDINFNKDWVVSKPGVYLLYVDFVAGGEQVTISQ